MMKLTHTVDLKRWISLFGALFVALLLVLGASVAQAKAEDEQVAGKHVLTVYDGGVERGILTSADTLGEALEESGVVLSENDVTEPSLDEKLVAGNYRVNIYRARPVVVIDGEISTKIMSPYRSVDQIAEQANIELRDEDEAELMASTLSMLGDGALERMVIDRATPFKLVLYGKKIDAYTQATTVEDMLEQKDIKLGKKDKLSLPLDRKIVAGMTVEIYRDGKQTITVEEVVKKPIREIQDANREAGYRQIKTPGKDGAKQVTYEVVMKNGKEISRKKISSVTTKQPTEEVVIVGSKSSFSGDFAAALSKLRSCEGGYNSWNPAGPYYGAYQFDQATWSGVTDAPYGSATPAEQDEAAHRLYLKRGWQPWPVCGASLPDTYR